MEIIKNIKNSIEKIKNLPGEQLVYIKFGLFGILIVDVLVFHWLLGWKTLAIALLIVILPILAFTLHLINQKAKDHNPKEDKKEEKPKRDKKMENIFPNNEEKAEKTQNKDMGEEREGFNLPLPTTEEYNERLEDQFSFKFALI